MLTKNQEIELDIIDIGNDGEGIGRYEDGMTVFVTGGLPGDKVLAHIVKVNKTLAYAFVVKVILPSLDRITPKCAVFDKCGGCTLQHLSYEAQLKYKQEKVSNCVKRIGGIENPPMKPIVGADNPFYYRNKAQFPVGKDKTGKPIIGFYRKHSHDVVECDDCCIQHKVNKAIIDKIQAFIAQKHISIYDEETGKGLLRHIFTRVGIATGEVMICLVINGDKMPEAAELADILAGVVSSYNLELKSFCLNINRKNTNVIMGNKCVTVFGREYIEDCIGDVRFRISPLSFYQVNPAQTYKLYSLASEYAGLTGNEIVWDLYCGIGTISLFLAKKAGKVFGVEIVPEAIEDAKINASINGITNAEFFVGAAEDVADSLPIPDIIVVDPPRKGCDSKLLETILRVRPKRLVYVSCDPATLARDLKQLSLGGYIVEKVRPVDQFCHTTHVETVCLLSKLHEAKHHVSVKLDMDEMDITAAESKATYEEIKKYVAEHNDGMHVSNLYIAQVKRKCGLELVENHNLPKSEDARQPQCPVDKEKAIMDALEYFRMI